MPWRYISLTYVQRYPFLLYTFAKYTLHGGISRLNAFDIIQPSSTWLLNKQAMEVYLS
jgi:hypothetical protein